MSKSKEVSVAFSGAGFSAAYYAGVILCLKRFAPNMVIGSATGASAGALAACCLLSKKPVEEYIAPFLLFCHSIRRFTMGPFSPCCNLDEILRETLDEALPNDILDDVSGKLHISVTRVRDKKNFLICDFSSKEDLIDCLRASSFIPVFSSMIPPIFRGERYMDGLFTDNLPKIAVDAVTVSPFSGDADISPTLTAVPKYRLKFPNNSVDLTWDNVKTLWKSVWPQTIETLMDFAEDGFKRTILHLIANDIIRCEICKGLDSEPFKPCEQCHLTRFDLLQAGLPDDIHEIVQNASKKEQEEREKDHLPRAIINKVSVILVPLTLPVELLIAVMILCIPRLISAHNSIKGYFATRAVPTVVIAALLIPVEICWVTGAFAIRCLYIALRILEDVVLANMKTRFSSIDYDAVKDRLVTILLTGILLPMEIWNIMFVFIPHYVVTNIPILQEIRINEPKIVNAKTCTDGTAEEQKSLLERACIGDTEEQQGTTSGFMHI